MSERRTNRVVSGLALLALALLAFVGAPEAARAQVASGPTLLVLGTVSQDSDPSVAGAATSALQSVARERGYTIVALDPSAPRVSIDLHTGDALNGFTMQTGIDRTLHLHVFRDGASYALHLGLGSRDGSAAVSLLRIAPLAEVAATLTEMTRALLPPPGTAASGPWIAPPDATVATTAEVPPAPATTTVTGAAPTTSASAFAPPPEPVRPARPQREHRDRTPLALTIAGAAMLGGGWVLNFFGGVFSGVCLGCSSSAVDRWDTFRAVSFIPVVGPWVQIAILPDTSNWWPLWLVIDGLLQTAGLVMLIAGISLLGNDDEPAAPTIALLPSLAPDHARLDLVGTF